MHTGDRAVGSSEALLATLSTAEAATRARTGTGVNTSSPVRVGHAAAGKAAVLTVAHAKAGVRMTKANGAAGHSATGVSATVGDGRSSLRKLGASHNSRADATTADHGPGTTTDD